MARPLLTYPDVLARYRQLLAQHPGQALILNAYAVALMDPATHALGWAFFDPGTSVIDLGKRFDFDERAFYEGHWEGDTCEQTLAAIEAPRYIDLPSVDEAPAHADADPSR